MCFLIDYFGAIGTIGGIICFIGNILCMILRSDSNTRLYFLYGFLLCFALIGVANMMEQSGCIGYIHRLFM